MIYFFSNESLGATEISIFFLTLFDTSNINSYKSFDFLASIKPCFWNSLYLTSKRKKSHITDRILIFNPSILCFKKFKLANYHRNYRSGSKQPWFCNSLYLTSKRKNRKINPIPYLIPSILTNLQSKSGFRKPLL